MDSFLAKDVDYASKDWHGDLSWAIRASEPTSSEDEIDIIHRYFEAAGYSSDPDSPDYWAKNDETALNAARRLLQENSKSSDFLFEVRDPLAKALKLYAYNFRLLAPYSKHLPENAIPNYLKEFRAALDTSCTPDNPASEIINHANQQKSSVLKESNPVQTQVQISPPEKSGFNGLDGKMQSLDGEPLARYASDPFADWKPVWTKTGAVQTFAREVDIPELKSDEIVWGTESGIPRASKPMDVVQEFREITFHMSEGQVTSSIHDIDSFHRNGRGWSMAGYHFAIDMNGKVYELRPLPYQGAHAKSDNNRRLGVVFIGNFEPFHPVNNPRSFVNGQGVPLPSPEAVASAVALSKALGNPNSELNKHIQERAALYKLRPARMDIDSWVGHDEVCSQTTGAELAHTLCPGKGIMAAVNGIRERFTGTSERTDLFQILQKDR